MHQITDENGLLEQVAKGNETAFARLFDRYHSSIYATALRLLDSPAAAEEVVQDVFLDVWMQRKQLTTIASFPAWLHRIARNTIFSAFRRNLRHRYEPLSLLPESLAELHPEKELNARDYQVLLQNAVERLSPKQKQTYRLIREQGYSRKEVADILQVSPETVKFNLEEALRKLRAYCLAHLKYLGILITALIQKFF